MGEFPSLPYTGLGGEPPVMVPERSGSGLPVPGDEPGPIEDLELSSELGELGNYFATCLAARATCPLLLGLV